MPVETESVWRALTSPHRRRLLDLLRDGPLTTGQISKQIPELSRFAVMQHLGVLEEAQLVIVKRDGRQRFNYANPMPLRDIYDRWVSTFSSTAAETTQHLRRYAEAKSKELQQMNDPTFRVVKIELEVDIAAPPELVFDALTKDMDNWWPHRVKPDGGIRHDAKLGGAIAEEWTGGGALYGTIIAFDPPHRCSSTTTGFMGRACTFANDDVVEPKDGGCVYKKSLCIWGDVSQELEEMFRSGSAAILKGALKSYCEEGKRYEH